jgi:hypothetical protein
MPYPMSPIMGSIEAPLDLTNATYDLGLHTASATKRSEIGRRLITDDGRVYRYCLATTGGVDAYHGAISLADDVIGEVVDTDAPSAAASIGETSTFITQTGFVKDQLVGAYLFMYATTGGQFRRIVHNDASLAAKTKIFVDQPWDQAIAGTEYCEMFENPYSLCTKTATAKASTIAVPACTAASGYYFWGQTWGPCVVSPGHALEPTGHRRAVGFGTNGCVFLIYSYHDAGMAHAGFVLNYNSDNGPLIMLQISV